MTDVTSTPPALRWVALFLAACAVLGLFLGFRDQIRKNPPGWYTGAEQVAAPLVTPADGARDAVPFDPEAAKAAAAAPRPAAPSAKTPAEVLEEPAASTEAAPPPESPAARPIAPPVLTPTPPPKLKPAAPPSKPAPSADPVGDILEGQKSSETPAAVPY